uniref:DUF4781 domain-containing protein n=1 Tax=Timema douglasi TaxID=61478 RepID=A0A7R8VHU3_TIMDO|nr:unnamed protein product [Timema douglasi]
MENSNYDLPVNGNDLSVSNKSKILFLRCYEYVSNDTQPSNNTVSAYSTGRAKRSKHACTTGCIGVRWVALHTLTSWNTAAEHNTISSLVQIKIKASNLQNPQKNWVVLFSLYIDIALKLEELTYKMKQHHVFTDYKRHDKSNNKRQRIRYSFTGIIIVMAAICEHVDRGVNLVSTGLPLMGSLKIRNSLRRGVKRPRLVLKETETKLAPCEYQSIQTQKPLICARITSTCSPPLPHQPPFLHWKGKGQSRIDVIPVRPWLTSKGGVEIRKPAGPSKLGFLPKTGYRLDLRLVRVRINAGLLTSPQISKSNVMLFNDLWHDRSKLFYTIQFTRISAIRFSLVNKVNVTTIIIVFPSCHVHVFLIASYLDSYDSDLTSSTACDVFVLDPTSYSNELVSDAGDFIKYVELLAAGFPRKFLKSLMDFFSPSGSNFRLFRPPAPLSFLFEEKRCMWCQLSAGSCQSAPKKSCERMAAEVETAEKATILSTTEPDENKMSWVEQATKEQQFLYESLGDRDWDSYMISEWNLLERNIGHALYGSPNELPDSEKNEETGYDKNKLEHIKNICTVIKEQDVYRVKTNNDILVAVVFVFLDRNGHCDHTPVFRIPKYDRRSVSTLVDKGNHGQSIGLKDSEARSCYLTIVGGALGMASGAGVKLVSRMAQNGEVMSKAGRILVTALNMSSLAANGAGVLNSLILMRERYKSGDLTNLEIFQFASQVLFFTNSLINIKTANAIIKDNQKVVLNEFEASLRSNKHRRMYRRLAMNTRGEQDAMHGDAKVIKAITHIENPDDFFARDRTHKMELEPHSRTPGEKQEYINESQVVPEHFIDKNVYDLEKYSGPSPKRFKYFNEDEYPYFKHRDFSASPELSDEECFNIADELTGILIDKYNSNLSRDGPVVFVTVTDPNILVNAVMIVSHEEDQMVAANPSDGLVDGPDAQQLQPSITHLSPSGLDPMSEELILPSEYVVILYSLAGIKVPSSSSAVHTLRPLSTYLFRIWTHYPRLHPGDSISPRNAVCDKPCSLATCSPVIQRIVAALHSRHGIAGMATLGSKQLALATLALINCLQLSKPGSCWYVADIILLVRCWFITGTLLGLAHWKRAGTVLVHHWYLAGTHSLKASWYVAGKHLLVRCWFITGTLLGLAHWKRFGAWLIISYWYVTGNLQLFAAGTLPVHHGYHAGTLPLVSCWLVVGTLTRKFTLLMGRLENLPREGATRWWRRNISLPSHNFSVRVRIHFAEIGWGSAAVIVLASISIKSSMKEGLRPLEGSSFPPPVRAQPLACIPPLRIGAFLPRGSPFLGLFDLIVDACRACLKTGSVRKRKLTETSNEVPCTSFDTDWTNNTTPQQPEMGDRWISNPFKEEYLEPASLSIPLKEKFLELASDTTLKNLFNGRMVILVSYWSRRPDDYRELSRKAIIITHTGVENDLMSQGPPHFGVSLVEILLAAELRGTSRHSTLSFTDTWTDNINKELMEAMDELLALTKEKYQLELTLQKVRFLNQATRLMNETLMMRNFIFEMLLDLTDLKQKNISHLLNLYVPKESLPVSLPHHEIASGHQSLSSDLHVTNKIQYESNTMDCVAKGLLYHLLVALLVGVRGRCAGDGLGARPCRGTRGGGSRSSGRFGCGGGSGLLSSCCGGVVSRLLKFQTAAQRRPSTPDSPPSPSCSSIACWRHCRMRWQSSIALIIYAAQFTEWGQEPVSNVECFESHPGCSECTYRSVCDVGDILKLTPLGTVSTEYRAFSSLPNKWVANPKLHMCLWKTATKSSGTTSLKIDSFESELSVPKVDPNLLRLFALRTMVATVRQYKAFAIGVQREVKRMAWLHNQPKYPSKSTRTDGSWKKFQRNVHVSKWKPAYSGGACRGEEPSREKSWEQPGDVSSRRFSSSRTNRRSDEPKYVVFVSLRSLPGIVGCTSKRGVTGCEYVMVIGTSPNHSLHASKNKAQYKQMTHEEVRRTESGLQTLEYGVLREWSWKVDEVLQFCATDRSHCHLLQLLLLLGLLVLLDGALERHRCRRRRVCLHRLLLLLLVVVMEVLLLRQSALGAYDGVWNRYKVSVAQSRCNRICVEGEWKTSLSTHDRDPNLDLPIIDSSLQHESDALVPSRVRVRGSVHGTAGRYGGLLHGDGGGGWSGGRGGCVRRRLVHVQPVAQRHQFRAQTAQPLLKVHGLVRRRRIWLTQHKAIKSDSYKINGTELRTDFLALLFKTGDIYSKLYYNFSLFSISNSCGDTKISDSVKYPKNLSEMVDLITDRTLLSWYEVSVTE